MEHNNNYEYLIKNYYKIQEKEKHLWSNVGRSWICQWENSVTLFGDRTVIIEVDGHTRTYQQLDKLSGNYYIWSKNINKEKIGIRLENSAEFIAAVIGLLKAGVIAVLLPDDEPPEMTQKTALTNGVSYIISDINVPGIHSVSPEEISNYVTDSTLPNTQKALLNSTAVVIFTSGTTGSRKGALFSHQRLIGAGIAWSIRTKMTSKDRCYISLPLFHGNALAVAFAACVQVGATAVIRRRFSPGALLDDVRKYDCSAMVYVGELWRLMDKIPAQHNDAINPLKVIFGNGLSAHLWEKTIGRFGITDIVEHYGATEMPASALTNWTNRPGYCGFIPPEHPDADNIAFIDKNNRLQKHGNIGELALGVPDNTYHGYLDASFDQDKVFFDINTEKLWWRSGDILSRTSDGFYSFIEREGDNFRWKGQNISVTDVEALIYQTGLVDEVVFVGVSLPHHHDKAGIAHIHPADGFELLKLTHTLRKHLALYTLPCFLKIQQMPQPMTATLKIRRQELIKSGWECADYVLHNGEYIELTETLINNLLVGENTPNLRAKPDNIDIILNNIAFATRLWDGPRGIPSLHEIQRWTHSSHSCSSHLLAAVDLHTDKALGASLKALGVILLPIIPWQSTTSPLNVLIRAAMLAGAEYLLLQSADICISKENVIQLLSQMDNDTLVTGAKICASHGAQSGTVALDGSSSPWNTCALWNLKKLAITGFLAISDGFVTPEKSGMEEVSVIALQQHLFPAKAKAKLIELQLPQSVLLRGKRSMSDIENMLESKMYRAANQLKTLNVPPGNVLVITGSQK